MPLVQGKSKKSFSENVKREMDAGKPQPQALAIAYSVKRKNMRKKKALGGEITANDERRANADNAKDNRDLKMMASGGSVEIDFESEKRANADDAHTPEELEMLRRKRMASGGAIEIDFVSEKRANANNADDEEEMNMVKGKRMQREQEITANDERSANADNASDDRDLDMYADGGMINADSEDEDEMRMIRGKSMRHSDDLSAKSERRPSTQSDDDDGRDMDMLDDHYDSIADSIIAKRKRFAEGGQVDLEANSREDKNNEDDYSYEALLKEQYDDGQLSPQPRDSNLHGHELSDEDAHDMVEAIRRKLRAKRG